MTAQIAAQIASPHPARRAGIAEFAAGTVAGRTNVRIAAVAPAEKYPLNTPENRMLKPTTAIAAAASHGLREHSVPSVIHGARAPECEVSEHAGPRRACELGQDEEREGSKGPEPRRRRIPDHLVRKREHSSDHDRGARGAL
jgi:hypothetical protein